LRVTSSFEKPRLLPLSNPPTKGLKAMATASKIAVLPPPLSLSTWGESQVENRQSSENWKAVFYLVSC
jgi:hypothetical protein